MYIIKVYGMEIGSEDTLVKALAFVKECRACNPRSNMEDYEIVYEIPEMVA